MRRVLPERLVGILLAFVTIGLMLWAVADVVIAVEFGRDWGLPFVYIIVLIGVAFVSAVCLSIERR